jgi:hypothetical protein
VKEQGWAAAAELYREGAAEWGCRVEAAEARVRELEEALRDINLWIASCVAVEAMPTEGAMRRMQRNRALLGSGEEQEPEA